MNQEAINLLKTKTDQANLDKLLALDNAAVVEAVAEYVRLCDPAKVFVRSDQAEDIKYLREKATELGEETRLATAGHTVHFDGFSDQARDKKNTKYLLPPGVDYGRYLNSIDKQAGIQEVRGYFKDIMQGKEMYVCFFCLGPVNSPFSILALQITDSAYVVHSEDILYRPAYEQFKQGNIQHFFKLVHSAGVLEGAVSKDVARRRVYIDLEDNLVYSVNTQYAGNTVGLKKLSLRLAIQKAAAEGWLAEHMFVMGVHNDRGKPAYFCGAYPSMCGKTSTAMLVGESIIGDDIAYLRAQAGKVFAVNVERGIFGIIKDVNSQDDPILFESLSSPGEVIVSNVLIDEQGLPFWLGKDAPSPERGRNFSGDWFPGKQDEQGKEITPSHKNARYTVRLSALKNVDSNLESPQGVEVSGLIYGGRDSDTWPPVEEALSWQQGVIAKAGSLESETTAATLGQEGVRVFNPMANIDFLSVPLGKYIEMNLNFGTSLASPSRIFSTNYFLRDKQGKFLNAIEDKRVWLKWMRKRIDGEVSARRTPTGLIPKYEDLSGLFRRVLDKPYRREDYIEQFSLRIPQNLAKIERIVKIYKESGDVCAKLFDELEAQKERLVACQREFGDYVSPENFAEV